MKPIYSVITVLLVMMITSVSFAATTFTNLSTADMGSNMATLVMQSNETGTGFFTLLTGSNPVCGNSGQVKAGKTASNEVAPYFGSLPLTATSSYTLRNLSQSTDYKACIAADGSTDNSASESLSFATTAPASLTFPGWGAVGTAGFSSSQAHFTSLAFAPDGTPYVAYVNANDSYSISVMSYNSNSWNLAGSSGFASGSANPVSLAFAPDGTPHLSFVDDSYTPRVFKFNGIDTWVPVGNVTALLADTDSTSLAFAPDGSPLVAYIDGTDSSAQVMTYSEGDWNSSSVSTASAGSPSLAVAPDGTPYLAYADYGYGGKATGMKFTGTGWTAMGSSGFTPGTAINTALAVAPDDSLYLAFQDGAAAGKATVMTFSNGSWSLVGNAGFSAGTAASISLAIAPDGKPAVAFQDGAKSGRTTVLKYNGSAWGEVGSAGFSTAAASSTALAFAPDGSPFVAYSDNGSGSRATLMQLTDIRPVISGNPPATANVGVTYSFTPAASFATSFSVTDNLPPGLSLNSETGTISGTPTTTGTYSGIIITASNSIGDSSMPPFSIVVSEASASGNVRIGTTLYENISTALLAAGSGSKLEILATINPAGVNFSGNGIITLAGGYYGDWSRDPGLFSPVSSLTITSGTLIIDQIAVSGP